MKCGSYILCTTISKLIHDADAYIEEKEKERKNKKMDVKATNNNGIFLTSLMLCDEISRFFHVMLTLNRLFQRNSSIQK